MFLLNPIVYSVAHPVSQLLCLACHQHCRISHFFLCEVPQTANHWRWCQPLQRLCWSWDDRRGHSSAGVYFPWTAFWLGHISYFTVSKRFGSIRKAKTYRVSYKKCCILKAVTYSEAKVGSVLDAASGCWACCYNRVLWGIATSLCCIVNKCSASQTQLSLGGDRIPLIQLQGSSCK